MTLKEFFFDWLMFKHFFGHKDKQNTASPINDYRSNYDLEDDSDLEDDHDDEWYNDSNSSFDDDLDDFDDFDNFF